MSKTLAIDLASRRYRDVGFALLEEGKATPHILEASDLGVEDPPEAKSLAAAIGTLADDEDVDVVLLDGPQGWRHPSSPIENMRLCERVLNTPAKTGVPGVAKPGNFLKYIEFSIDLFQYLRTEHGWSLLTEDWANLRGKRWAVEVYPSSAWSLLGLDRLPGKSKAGKKLGRWRKSLAQVTGYTLPSDLSHDELQAAVVLPLGYALQTRREDLLILAGIDPIIEDDMVYEGLIANPRLAVP